jgi:hypothetical protein
MTVAQPLCNPKCALTDIIDLNIEVKAIGRGYSAFRISPIAICNNQYAYFFDPTGKRLESTVHVMRINGMQLCSVNRSLHKSKQYWTNWLNDFAKLHNISINRASEDEILEHKDDRRVKIISKLKYKRKLSALELRYIKTQAKYKNQFTRKIKRLRPDLFETMQNTQPVATENVTSS